MGKYPEGIKWENMERVNSPQESLEDLRRIREELRKEVLNLEIQAGHFEKSPASIGMDEYNYLVKALSIKENELAKVEGEIKRLKRFNN